MWSPIPRIVALAWPATCSTPPSTACTGAVVLAAQSHLTHVYARHGFVADGDEFLDDGIPHTPMRRPPPDAR